MRENISVITLEAKMRNDQFEKVPELFTQVCFRIRNVYVRIKYLMRALLQIFSTLQDG